MLANKKIDPDADITPLNIKKQLNSSITLFNKNGITITPNRNGSRRLIILTRVAKVEKAAYCAGEKLLSDYNGRLHDYTKKGGVVHSEIMLPGHATLWNAVEQIEKNENSQLVREIELSLPVELSLEQNINLARDYVQTHFVDKGMCADVCVHDKGDGNPHAHIVLTLRPIEQDGVGALSQKGIYPRRSR